MEAPCNCAFLKVKMATAKDNKLAIFHILGGKVSNKTLITKYAVQIQHKSYILNTLDQMSTIQV